MPALFHGYGAVDISSCTALAVAQGLTVVLPRRPRRVALRIPHTWAAILPPAAFLATVAGLAMHPSLALAVVAVACVGVPVLGALAIARLRARRTAGARAAGRSRCWRSPRCTSGVAGELAVLTLVMLSCVALGSLLAAVAGSARARDRGAAGRRARPRAHARRRHPRSPPRRCSTRALGRMPDFAQPVLGRMTIGYGDFFVAALAGAIAARQAVAARRSSRWPPRPSRWRSTRSPATATCCRRRRPSPWRMLVAALAGRLRRRRAAVAAVPAI